MIYLEVIKSIVEKLKIKELFGILFIACLFITFIPAQTAKVMGLEQFRSKYQLYLTIVIVFIGSYYLYHVIKFLTAFILAEFNNNKRIAIKYMKEKITTDEMELIIETFYDRESNRFKSTGVIAIQDGRIKPLESHKIIYIASAVGNIFGFSYNLYPAIYDFLNENLMNGKIIISKYKNTWNFK